MKLDVGCGEFAREGYVGMDIEKHKCVEIVADLRKPFPLDAKSVEAINCSHVLEHFTDSEAMHIIEECYRVMEPGGQMEVVVPNFPEILKAFLEDTWGRKWTVHHPKIWGKQDSPGEFHKTGFDADKIAGMLEYAGFKNTQCEEVWTHMQPSIRVTCQR